MMFGKKLCKRCGKKSGSKDNFCPNCGTPISSSENLGMLGKKDEQDEFEQFSKELFGGFSGSVINKMFNSAVKMLEKEMQKEIKNTPQHTEIQLFVNGRKINFGGQPPQERKRITRKKVQLPNSLLKKFSSMPKEEPKIDMRRFPDRIVYEIEIPGVNSTEDISIVPLENSIEIKALAKDKSYFKLIPVNFPITNYKLSDGKLILEFRV